MDTNDDDDDDDDDRALAKQETDNNNITSILRYLFSAPRTHRRAEKVCCFSTSPSGLRRTIVTKSQTPKKQWK